MPVRAARESDLEDIIALIHGLAEYEREPEAVVLVPDELREHLFGPRPYAEVLIAELEGGETAGFALFFHNYSTWMGRPGIWLEDLFVLPEHRGKGLGRALLVEIARVAQERRCGRVEWSVLDWNEPSIGFYRALGAVPMDEWTTFRLTGDAITQLAG
jgi:GNAT superfamily N-acetyltransferase